MNMKKVNRIIGALSFRATQIETPRTGMAAFPVVDWPPIPLN
jgi:hypothetical protein